MSKTYFSILIFLYFEIFILDFSNFVTHFSYTQQTSNIEHPTVSTYNYNYQLFHNLNIYHQTRVPTFVQKIPNKEIFVIFKYFFFIMDQCGAPCLELRLLSFRVAHIARTHILPFQYINIKYYLCAFIH